MSKRGLSLFIRFKPIWWSHERPWLCCHWGKLMLTWGILLLSVITVTVCTICYLLLNPCSALSWAEAIMAWVWKYFSTAPADIDMEPTSYPNNPINEPSHRIWFRFKFINSDWNGSWIGCLCFDYNRSLTKSITIDCNGVRSSIMIIYERAQSEGRAANNPSVSTITDNAPTECLSSVLNEKALVGTFNQEKGPSLWLLKPIVWSSSREYAEQQQMLGIFRHVDVESRTPWHGDSTDTALHFMHA